MSVRCLQHTRVGSERYVAGSFCVRGFHANDTERTRINRVKASVQRAHQRVKIQQEEMVRQDKNLPVGSGKDLIMFGPITIGAVVAVAVILQVYLVARIVRQDRKLSEREKLVEKLRSELAAADASLFRLNDRLAELAVDAKPAPAEAVVELFPKRSLDESVG